MNMAIKTSAHETINALNAIFEKHKNERICVLGTTCCGKSTLQEQIPGTVDMDEALWPQLTNDEEAYICQKPWTREIGDFTRKLVKEKVTIKVGQPIFSLILLEAEVIVYLDLSDELLAEHCKKRGSAFQDAKNVKDAIEEAWNRQRENNEKVFYYLNLTE
jgi:energy-coupling factor transporter ATP-binding protein EcfA2